MAKVATKPAEEGTVVPFTPSHKLSFETYTVDDYRTLPPQSVERLINLGFSTALKNSKAGLGVTGLGKWTPEEIAAEHATHGTETIEALSAKLGTMATDKQFAAILSGTAVTRAGGTRGPRAVGIEKYIREAALRVVHNAITAYNAKNPGAKMAAPTKAVDVNAAIERLKGKPVWAKVLEAAKTDFERDSAMGSDLEGVLDIG